MKRPYLPALIIGLIAGVVALGLHFTGALRWPETAIANLLSRPGKVPSAVSGLWQFFVVMVLALAVALMTFMTTRPRHLAVVMAVLFVELAAAAWVCSLYGVLFQPLPVLIGTALSFFGTLGFLKMPESSTAESSLDRAAASPVDAGLAASQTTVKRSEPPADSNVRASEVTVLVCDIANKHDLADECEPALFIEITQKFLAHATEALRKAGAYIESAGGEGVVAIFGFPEGDPQHAEKAARSALLLSQTFPEIKKFDQASVPANLGVHAGVSSGRMILAPVKNNGQRGLLATGEPVELARRFCIANRFYGTRVLLGPRSFELASKILVARPIDFLSGVEARERHEIYEPVALALEATRDQITRRDAFWKGVVLYREKRWAEAYSQFQNARSPSGDEDRPLQLYLRRIEPLALQLTHTPLEE